MLVSVVITAYNAEKYIGETLRSVFAQTYKPIEIVVADDGSTDGTAHIIKTDFPDVRYIYQPNAGQPAARNAGIRHARGEFIAFVDSDDLWFPQKIARQVERLSQSNAAWCYCDCIHFLETPDHILYRYSAITRPSSGMILEPLLLGNFIASPTPMIRRDALLEIGLWDEAVIICEDWNTWLKLATRFAVEYVDEPLAAYRVRAQSMSKVWLLPKILESHLSVLSSALRQLQVRNSGIANRARANIYFMVGLGYLKRGDRSAGRRMLFRALLKDPLQLRLYVYLSISWLPPSFVSAANVWRHRYFRAAKPMS